MDECPLPFVSGFQGWGQEGSACFKIFQERIVGEEVLGRTVSPSGPRKHFSNIIPLAGGMEWQSGDHFMGWGRRCLRTGSQHKWESPRGQRLSYSRLKALNVVTQTHF